MQRMAIICVVLALSLSGRARAEPPWCSEEPCVPRTPDATRTLNAHAFLPFQTAPWPFVTSRVGSQTQMGVVKLESIPVVQMNPDVVVNVSTNDAKLVAFSQGFVADVRLARFLGLAMGFGVGNAVGINSAGAFNVGINYAFGGILGAIFRIAQTDKWYLSFRLEGVAQRAEAVLPAQLVQTAETENGMVTFSVGSLTQGGNITRGTGYLMFSASPHRMIGLQSAVGFQMNRVEVESRSGRADNFLASLGGSLRFNSLGVPVAVMFGGALQVRTDQTRRVFFPTIGNQGTVAGFLEPAIFYSDPKYVDVGISAIFQLASNDHRKQGLLVINHFW